MSTCGIDKDLRYYKTQVRIYERLSFNHFEYEIRLHQNNILHLSKEERNLKLLEVR